jgi:predicted ATPase
LPFIEDTTITTLEDSSFLLYQKEFDMKRPVPSILISDGTINVIALITALFFGNESFLIIEEPERNIHPDLISKLVDMIKDLSERMEKQILLTTHNPLFVKNVDVENLLFVTRNEDGFSEILCPSEMEEVQAFLKNEIGIDELFIQNLLGD